MANKAQASVGRTNLDPYLHVVQEGSASAAKVGMRQSHAMHKTHSPRGLILERDMREGYDVLSFKNHQLDSPLVKDTI